MRYTRNAVLAFLALLLSVVASAQTTTELLTKYAATTFPYQSNPVQLALVTVDYQAGDGTIIDYSFCLYETPGCEEGTALTFWGVDGNKFTGTVGSSYLTANVLTLYYDFGGPNLNLDGMVSYYCWAFDSEGNCTSSTPAPGGIISLTFTKTPASATVGSSMTEADDSGTIQTSTTIDDVFSAEAAGTVIGTTVTSAGSYWGTQMGFTERINATKLLAAATVPLSKRLEGRLPEKALRRLLALERRRDMLRGKEVK
jgi:hypothetical protein